MCFLLKLAAKTHCPVRTYQLPLDKTGSGIMLKVLLDSRDKAPAVCLEYLSVLGLQIRNASILTSKSLYSKRLSIIRRKKCRISPSLR